MFTKLARFLSDCLGHSFVFSSALLLILGWLALGPYFHFSESWELFINSFTTIVTFLMVFLLQNTQNRDTMAIQLKLDEIIRSIQGSHNELVKIEEASDDELKATLERYENLASQIKKKIGSGQQDEDCPPVDESDSN